MEFRFRRKSAPENVYFTTHFGLCSLPFIYFYAEALNQNIYMWNAMDVEYKCMWTKCENNKLIVCGNEHETFSYDTAGKLKKKKELFCRRVGYVNM